MKKLKKKKSNLELKKEISDIENHLNRYCREDGHRIPQTRREFLSMGLLSSATMLGLPSLSSLLSQSAWAQSIGCSENMLPTFINLQLAGGPAMFANHLAAGSNGQGFGTSYGFLGVGQSPNIDRFFANNAPFLARATPNEDGDVVTEGSGFMRGLKDRLDKIDPTYFDTIVGGQDSPGGQPGKTTFVSVACKSIDDRFTNPHDFIGMMERAGVTGIALPSLLCEAGGANITANVGKGILRYRDAFFQESQLKYLRANTPEALSGALGLKGALLTELAPGLDANANIAVQGELLSAINGLTQYQAEALVQDPKSRSAEKAFMDLAKNFAQKNAFNVNNFKDTNFDVYSDPASPLANIWQQNFDNLGGGRNLTIDFKNEVTAQFATTISAALNCYSGMCTAVIGGYDYHTGQLRNREEQNNHDYFFGETVANILATAHHLQRPVFLYVSSDGSVASEAGVDTSPSQPWNADYGERGMNYILAYHPTKIVQSRGYSGANSYRDANFQLNHFTRTNTQGGISSTDLIVATENPIASIEAQPLAAAGVFLNYLEFAGQKELIDRPELTIVRSNLQQASIARDENDIWSYFSRMGT